MPNALLVYPEFPPSYWGFKFALEFVGKRSAMPPLGLLTVAGMFPKEYRLNVVDMNLTSLSDVHLSWADVVLTSTMILQRDSLYDVIRRCNRAGVPIVAGGPHPTTYHDDIRREAEGTVDHFLLGEVEETFAPFLMDLANGTAKGTYPEPRKPDITKSPLPRFDLIDFRQYSSMAVQFSRGCPFDCEFCDITKLFGRAPRTKSADQMLAEFDLLHRLGWTGPVFLVDDNFIGNKREALRLLPRIAEWQQQRRYPFSLYTEASVNLARVPDLLDGMSDAGFNMVFVGIESPNRDTLVAAGKKQNAAATDDAAGYLLRSVRRIQEHGMEVSGGFIIGLDGDTEFDSHIRFIQEAGIPLAMAGLLSAVRATDLYERLDREGRLLGESTGNNTDMTLNFVPILPRKHVLSEYRRVLATLYDPTLKNYFDRCLTMLRHLKPTRHTVRKIGGTELLAFVRSIRRQFLFSRQGPAYVRFLTKVLWERPRMLPEAVRLAIMGYHFEKITSQIIVADDFKRFLESELEALKERVTQFARVQDDRIGEARVYVQALFSRVRRHHEEIHSDFRYVVRDALVSFQEGVASQLELLGGSARTEIQMSLI
jgi:radical SAM superfamily enzyme YgiQ (UPF0313 family)